MTIELLGTITKIQEQLNSATADSLDSRALAAMRKAPRYFMFCMKFGLLFRVPNRGRNVLDIELFSESNSQVDLMCSDFTGRMIMLRKLDAKKGINYFSCNTGYTSKGIYCLQVRSNTGKSNMIKFIK